MPHKHRREKTRSDPSYWDLPPNKSVQPPSVSKPTPSIEQHGKGPGEASGTSDTPRAFHRLFRPYRPPRSGEDDGSGPVKKRKTGRAIPDHAPPNKLMTKNPSATDLKIQPQEPLSHFSARVDQALSFATMWKSQSTSDPSLKGIGKPKRTKTERKMQKMQQAWREEDKKIKERKLAEGESREGAVDEEDVENMAANDTDAKPAEVHKRKKKREREEDPWKDIRGKRREGQERGHEDPKKGLVGLHDVVQAPPRFTQKAVKDDWRRVKQGGLKKQVELSEARRSVIEGYRAMMKGRREGINVS